VSQHLVVEIRAKTRICGANVLQGAGESSSMLAHPALASMFIAGRMLLMSSKMRTHHRNSGGYRISKLRRAGQRKSVLEYRHSANTPKISVRST